MERKTEGYLLWIAMAAVIATAVIYAVWFKDSPVGGPDDWSQFGDYFGGVLNPVIGIITVVLVVMTLRTTRKEAAETRDQMKQQIEHLERQAVLSDMHKRLDGVLIEWNRLLDQRAPGEFQAVYGAGPGTATSNRSVRGVIEDNERYYDLVARSRNHQGVDKFVDTRWSVFKHDLVPLLCELDQYCLEYEWKSGSKVLTDFYKARIKKGLLTLRAAGITPDTATARLLNEPQEK